MESIIEKLYNGKVFPSEQILPKSPVYKQAVHKIEQMKDILQSRITPEDFLKLEEMEEALSDASDMDTMAGFAYGLRLGILLMYELMEENPR